MSDLRRQIATARNERDREALAHRAMRDILGDIPTEYAQAYSALCDLSYHGCRRPDDLGGPINNGHASSKPPTYHPAAYHYRNEERRALRHRADRIMTLVERLVDPPTNHTGGPSVVVRFEVSESA